MKALGTYGVMAEFNTAAELIAAGRRAYAEGYRRMDAYSPFPLHEIDEAIGIPKTKLPWMVFTGGVLGGCSGYGLAYFCQAISYPVNIGGKAMNSWTAFIPITFELTILGASLTAVIAMMALNGLPRPYHPVFNNERFVKAGTRDKFFLCIESDDPKFRLDDVRNFLKSLNPADICEVPH
jgi:hypothetical protein